MSKHPEVNLEIHQIFEPSAVSAPAQVLYKGGFTILARVLHMSDGNAQEAQSLYVRHRYYSMYVCGLGL